MVSHVYLANASPSENHVKRCDFRDKCLLNIGHDAAGLAEWLDWEGTVAEIAIFESTYRSLSNALPLGSLSPCPTFLILTHICC